MPEGVDFHLYQNVVFESDNQKMRAYCGCIFLPVESVKLSLKTMFPRDVPLLVPIGFSRLKK
jgi:hypothetical protein